MQIVWRLPLRGHYRLPLDCERVRRQEATGYRAPTAVVRPLRWRVRRPAWATKGSGLAEAASPAQETLTLIKKRGDFFVRRRARPWKFTDERAGRDLGQPLPRARYRQPWLPRSDGRRRGYGGSL
jgi:hypothetical protein